MMFIAVIGGGKCARQVYRLAEEVGRELARQGAILICGGLGGVMEAACKGAREVGGNTIGILPGNRSQEANPYVSIPIVTGMGEMRNVIIVKSSQAVIAIDGEFGTLSEISHALKNKIPVIGIGTWEMSRKGVPDESIIPADNPRDAVMKALAAATKR